MDHLLHDIYPLTQQILDRYDAQYLNSCSVETEGFEARLGVQNSWFLQNMSLEPKNGPTPMRRAKSLEDMQFHLWTLWEAMATHRPALFVAYMDWVKTTLTSYGLDLDDILASIAAMRDVLAESLPASEATTACDYVDAALQQLALPDASPHVDSFLKPDAPLADLAQQVLRALLYGDRRLAIQLVQTEALTKQNVKDIYLYVLQPVQREVGRLWQMRQFSVAMEHYCSETTQLMMSQLYPFLLAAPPHGHVLVATCVSREQHGIGMRMVADFFEMAGWESYYLGVNTPTNSVLQTVIERQADVLAISTTMTFHLGLVRELIAAARNTSTIARTKILVGGGPFNLVPDLWKEIGADGYGRDAIEAVHVAGQLVSA